MNFCAHCGQPVRLRIPPDDERERHCCDHCGTVHYQNPKLVLGTIPIWQDKILLCRRAIEPRRGFWTLPAGFMECGETLVEGAQRETIEEAGADITMGALFSIIDVPRIAQVHVFYLAQLNSLQFNPGSETLEVRLCSEADMPWDDLAFHTVRLTLQRFFADRARGAFDLHQAVIAPGHPAHTPA